MPQMAPLMWTSLFLMFASLLLMSMIKMTFLKKETELNVLVEALTINNQKNLNWKW